MDLRIFVEPQQGASYGQQLALARVAEECGYDAFFRSDHYLKMGDGDARPGPTDTWVTLAGIARETTTIRLGTLVCSATFRLPGPLAVAVAQVDDMSGGRVELGLGAGWFDDEHTAYGIPFPTLAERFDRLEEQLEIVTGLWSTPDGAQFTFEGEHYGLVGSPALPKAVQPGGPPVIVGGHGPRRTPALAARFAAEFNVPFAPVEVFATQRDRVRRACEAIGRPPEDMVFSAALVLCCGHNNEALERPRRRHRAGNRRAAGQRRRRQARRGPRHDRQLRRDRRRSHLPPGARHRRPRPPASRGRGGHGPPAVNDRTIRG